MSDNHNHPDIKVKEDYAALLPKLPPQEYESLKQSIREIGLCMPLIINQDRVLLDGYHRFKVCQELGLTQPTTMVKEFTDPLEEKKFIIELNRTRRHLTKFERIELQNKLEDIENELAKKRMSDAGRKGADKRWAARTGGKTQDGNNMNECEVVQNNTTLKETDNQCKEEDEENLPQSGRVIDLSAKKAHVSPMTYFKGREIIKKAPEEVKDLLRKDKVKIDKVFRRLQRQKSKEELLRSCSKESTVNLSNECMRLLQGGFVEKSSEEFIPNDSVDLIFTDPPYGKVSLPLYADLAKVASRVLKVGGSLVTNAGHCAIPDIIEFMKNEGLTYWWIFVLKLSGPFARSFYRGISIKWKPLLWFVKGNKKNAVDFISDYIESTSPEKALDDWEQSPTEAEHVISRLTLENQIVFDPMMGYGTTGVAAASLNRRFIGIEINSERFDLAKARLTRIKTGGSEKN